MSFLTPLFLLGGLAVAAPIVFHLIRRTSREKTPFSSLMFLSPSPPRITRRSRLEHIFLLLLRCLVLLLLAAGFARPFFTDAGEGDKDNAPGRRTLILVDTSASMRRSGLWEKATEAFHAALQEAGAEDAVAVYGFSQSFEPILSFERWTSLPAAQRPELARREFGKVKPGWGGTRLGMALARAAALLEEQEDDSDHDIPSRLILISDLQRGADLRELQSFEWPPEMALHIRPVSPAQPSNAGLQYLPPSPADFRTGETDLQKVRVYNAAESDHEQFTVSWRLPDGSPFGSPTEVYVPPGQSRVVALERPDQPAAGRRLLLSGDAEAFDNQAWLIPPEPRVVDWVYVGGETPEDIKAPLFFLKGALQDTREHVFRLRQFTPRQVIRPGGFTVVSEAVSEQGAAALREFLEAGGTALFAPRDAAALASMFQVFKAAPLGVEEIVPERYALLGEIEFQHPLFSYFADPRFSDFSKIHFWRYRRFAAESIAGARVLARFDNDDPALTLAPLGRGSAFILASSWYPTDSQLALSTKFVPLLYSMLEQGGLLDRTPRQYHVGDSVPAAFTNAASGVHITLPDGKDVVLSGGRSFFDETSQPGIYTMRAGTNTIEFAVNLDPSESRTDVLAGEELERYGVVLGNNTALESLTPEDKRRMKNAELENRQKLWRWLIVAALVVLSLEILAAGRLARPSTAPENTA